MKTNLFKKGIALALSAIACVSAVGCVGGDTSSSSSSSEDSKPTGKYVVSETGGSEYQILMPEQRDDNLNCAVSELQLGIEAATGYKMSATTNYVEGKKYLSVGKTALYEANKADVEGDGLDKLELRVLTVDDNVVMVGADNEYTVYAVYEWMERTFGFKWYTFQDYYVAKTDSIELLELDVSETAKMQMRCLYQWDFWVENPVVRNRRMRTHEWAEYHFSEGHNMVETILPKATYAAEHPEWYSKPYGDASAGQICVTNEACIAEFIERCKEIIEENWGDGSNKYFMLGAGDNFDYCKCDGCNAAAVENLNQAGNYIVFANKVSRAINEWVKTKDPNKTIYFPMYAYQFTEKAPVKEVNGEYVAVNENVVPDDTIMLMYAPVRASHTYAYSDPRNASVYTDMKQWEALTDQMVIYSYHFTRAYFYPFSDLNTNGASIQMALDTNYVGWIAESGTYYRFPSMQPLKNYIMSQMWWGTDKSVTELAYEFIDFYYGPVAKEFKSYYADMSQWIMYQAEEMKINIAVLGYEYASEENWPIGVVDYFDKKLDGIIQLLEPLQQTDPALYKKYFDHVNVEKLWTNWAYCELYRKYFSDSEYAARVDFVEKYVMEYKVQSSVATLEKIASWRK